MSRKRRGRRGMMKLVMEAVLRTGTLLGRTAKRGIIHNLLAEQPPVGGGARGGLGGQSLARQAPFELREPVAVLATRRAGAVERLRQRGAGRSKERVEVRRRGRSRSMLRVGITCSHLLVAKTLLKLELIRVTIFEEQRRLG
jgi:hypothetical protein